MTTTQNISFRRGDSHILRVGVKDHNGVAVDLINASIIFSMKKSKASAEYLIQKSSANPAQILIEAPATAGYFKIYIVPNDTKNLEEQTYVADVQITLGSGQVKTALDLKVILLADVTI